jgi:hypothetical protein
MARVFWDTNLFIDLFEKNAEWSPRVIELRQRMLARGDRLLTSYLTVGEVITKPKQLNNATVWSAPNEANCGPRHGIRALRRRPAELVRLTIRSGVASGTSGFLGDTPQCESVLRPNRK